MPKLLDIPMKKMVHLENRDGYVKATFNARRSHIDIESVLGRGIIIQARKGSETTSIGINDNYLASVTYVRRSFPIWIISFLFFFISGIMIAAGGPNDVGYVIGSMSIIFSLISLVMFFISMIGKISFCLADEQDYEILISSSAVQNPEIMEMFIARILMNSMGNESLNDTFNQAQQHPVAQQHPMAQQHPVAQ
ncbi:MAG: hypothetical protein CMB49_06110, partial [Euryarchaeota archaeon]|nr:hypothetical protein [Euryarchaeota archaeon]